MRLLIIIYYYVHYTVIMYVCSVPIHIAFYTLFGSSSKPFKIFLSAIQSAYLHLNTTIVIFIIIITTQYSTALRCVFICRHGTHIDRVIAVCTLLYLPIVGENFVKFPTRVRYCFADYCFINIIMYRL
jgi:hypothetical protein